MAKKKTLLSPETEVLALQICGQLKRVVGNDTPHFSSSILSIMRDLDLRDEKSAMAAIRRAVDNGWVIAEGEPIHSIRLARQGHFRYAPHEIPEGN
jgi:hypothetical protein